MPENTILFLSKCVREICFSVYLFLPFSLVGCCCCLQFFRFLSGFPHCMPHFSCGAQVLWWSVGYFIKNTDLCVHSLKGFRASPGDML